MRIQKNSRMSIVKKGIKTFPILLTVLLSFIFSSCTLMPKEEEVLAPPIKVPQAVTFETLEVKKGTIEQKIRVNGYFVPLTQKDLYFQNKGGRLKEIYVTKGEKVKKGQLLAEIDSGSIIQDIAVEQLVYQKLQINYERLKTQADLEGGGSKYELESANLDLQIEQKKIEKLKKDYNDSRLISPIDGDIVFIADKKSGDVINTYDNIISVADPKELQFEYVGDKATLFRLGMPVTIDYKDNTYKGNVVSTPEQAPSDASDIEKTTVRVKLNDKPPITALGENAKLNLVLDKQENTIVIPKQLLNNLSGRKYVNLLVNGIRVEKDVELGITNETEVEVIKGLEVGDLIIER